MPLYVVGGATVFVFSGVMAMAGLGAAFLFVPLFFYLGVPLAQATSAALLLNAVSLSMATISYARGRAHRLAGRRPGAHHGGDPRPGRGGAERRRRPLGPARVVRRLPRLRRRDDAVLPPVHFPGRRSPAAEVGVGAGVGGVAGFLGGLLGVGGGNIILPGLTWSGLDTKMAAGTTALAVVFSSLSGFLGRAALGDLDPAFLVAMAVLAALGSLVGAHLMRTRLTSPQLKRFIGVLLWVIAAKMALDLL